jgi:hypothetical protein
MKTLVWNFIKPKKIASGRDPSQAGVGHHGGYSHPPHTPAMGLPPQTPIRGGRPPQNPPRVAAQHQICYFHKPH